MSSEDKLKAVISKLKTGSSGNESLMGFVYVGRNYSKRDLLEDLRRLL